MVEKTEKKQEIFNFVHTVFGTFGQCIGYCEICKESHPSCGGDKLVDGNCPDECEGNPGFEYSITTDWYDRQVAECCFYRIFNPLKTLLDDYRKGFLQYYSMEIANEIEDIRKQKSELKRINRWIKQEETNQVND